MKKIKTVLRGLRKDLHRVQDKITQATDPEKKKRIGNIINKTQSL